MKKKLYSLRHYDHDIIMSQSQVSFSVFTYLPPYKLVNSAN